MYKTTVTEASNFVSGVDRAFLVILGISVILLIALTITMLYFIYKYNKKRHPKAIQHEGSTKLELIWTLIPTALVLVMFWFGWAGWKPMKEVPDDAFEIKAIARMWNFKFEYKNGKRTDTLYVPMGQPVKLNLVALDVLHGIYIPAFRVKEDMVPGKEKFMWFNANRPGKFDLFCSEYCGLQHAYMYSSVVVLPPEEFQTWYTDTTAVALVSETDVPGAVGKKLVMSNGCNACHSVDGSRLVGPTFKNLYGNMREIIEADGDEIQVKADETYIINSIYDPNGQLVKGYNKGLMLSYKDQISNEEMDLIIEYLKTLSDKN